MTEKYFPITKQELSLIKNDCFHPETDSCDGCEYVSDGEMPCTWKGANALEKEILSRPYQSSRDTVLSELEKWIDRLPRNVIPEAGFGEQKLREILMELRQSKVGEYNG